MLTNKKNNILSNIEKTILEDIQEKVLLFDRKNRNKRVYCNIDKDLFTILNKEIEEHNNFLKEYIYNVSSPLYIVWTKIDSLPDLNYFIEHHDFRYLKKTNKCIEGNNDFNNIRITENKAIGLYNINNYEEYKTKLSFFLNHINIKLDDINYFITSAMIVFSLNKDIYSKYESIKNIFSKFLFRYFSLYSNRHNINNFILRLYKSDAYILFSKNNKIVISNIKNIEEYKLIINILKIFLDNL